MRFAFKIFQTTNGHLELLLEPSPIDLPSTDAALRLARSFATYVPVHLITLENEDGLISELWFGDSKDIGRAHLGQFPLAQPAVAVAEMV